MDVFPVLQRYQDRFGFELDAESVQRLETFRDLLIDTNRHFNLTRVTDPAEIETRLFLDALGMLPMIRRSAPSDATTNRLLDVGTGAGFPGIPLKIVDPTIDLVLIEATAKKVTFVTQVIETLGLASAQAIHGRAEELAHDARYRSQFDAVTARAVSRLPALLEICMPFCRVGGRGIFPKGPDIDEEVADASQAAGTLRCKILGVERSDIPELAGTTYVIARQVDRPPTKYPRRPGIPSRDPL